VAAGHPLAQNLRRRTHQLDLACRADDRLRAGLRGAAPVVFATTSATEARCPMLTVEITSIPAASRSSTSCHG
jgi:hypothetical protein